VQSAVGLSLSPHISDVAEALGGEAGPHSALWRRSMAQGQELLHVDQ